MMHGTINIKYTASYYDFLLRTVHKARVHNVTDFVMQAASTVFWSVASQKKKKETVEL